MRLDIFDGNLDIKPGSVSRGLLIHLLGGSWEDYVTVYVEAFGMNMSKLFDRWKLHNEEGPAAVKKDGTMEWWLGGEKLFVKNQKEFDSYMRNKAFW